MNINVLIRIGIPTCESEIGYPRQRPDSIDRDDADVEDDEEQKREDERQAEEPGFGGAGDLRRGSSHRHRRPNDVEEELGRESRIKCGERIDQSHGEFPIRQKVNLFFLVLMGENGREV